jgi:hypothetical protein
MYFQEFGAEYRNVLAILPGGDREVSQEWIAVGAHYDHVGYGTSQNSLGPLGRIHNGADDNASGIAALLELIEACTLLPAPPRRTLLFAFWDAEEKGLLGSQHWVSAPTVPLHQVRFMLNLDMVGRLRDETLEVAGARTAAGLRRFVSEQNEASRLLLDFTWDTTQDSDHYSFFAKRIPYLMLHTRKHDDYHRPSDDADKVNFEGIEEVSRLMFHVVAAAADAPRLADFREASRSENNEVRDQRASASPPPALRFGVSWDQHESGANGIRVTYVGPRTPADKAGLRVDDRILEFAGRPIDERYDFRTHVLAAQNPVAVVFERGGERQEAVVQLEGPPVRIGISWGFDDAEPNCVTVGSVVPGSPAERAGLVRGDRIHATQDARFNSSAEFTAWMAQQSARADLVIERKGQIQRMRLELLPPVETLPAKATPP